MGRQEGRPYRVLPHPVVPGEFTIVPKEVADRGPLRDHQEVVGRKSDGGPFASTHAARKALEEAGLNGTHVVVPASALWRERIKGFLGIGVGGEDGEDAVASPLNGNRSVGPDDASVRQKVGGATIADGIGSADHIYRGDDELGDFRSSGRDENGVSRTISSSRAPSGKSAVDETGASYTEGGEELAGESSGGDVEPLMVVGTRPVSRSERTSGGQRRSANLVLDDGDINRLTKEFVDVGGDPSKLRFNKGGQTSYVD